MGSLEKRQTLVLVGSQNAMNRVTKRIGLLDHVGGGNLGDDATLTAVTQNIKTRWPHAQIAGFSMNPTDTEKRHGIPSYAIRRTTLVGSNPFVGDFDLDGDASPTWRTCRFACSTDEVLPCANIACSSRRIEAAQI